MSRRAKNTNNSLAAQSRSLAPAFLACTLPSAAALTAGLMFTVMSVAHASGVDERRPALSALASNLLQSKVETKIPTTQVPEGWDTWLSALSKGGYTVTQGAAYLLDSNSCQKYIQYFGTCAGNNPVAPYFIVQVPVVPGQYIDPYYAVDFEATTSENVPVSEFYRLGDNEALVVVMRMPPRAAYFGSQTYVYTRDVSKYADKTSASAASPDSSSSSGSMPDPNRVPTFASIGNAVNNVVMQREAGARWNDNVVGVITTSNTSLDHSLRAIMQHKAAHSHNPILPNRLISEPIGDFVYTGLDQTSDEFVTMLRYALPENLTAGSNWSSNPQNNLWVFRVTDNSGAPVIRAPTPSYTRKVATKESKLENSQKELANLLLGYSQSQFGYETSATSMLTTVYTGRDGTPNGQVGQHCVAAGIPCSGDNQDTDAYRVSNVGTLTGNQTVFVVGVDQTQYPAPLIANAAYISVGVYDGPTLSGVAGISQTSLYGTGFLSGSLTGSAAEVLHELGLYNQASPELQAQLKYFYIVGVARNCPTTNGWCLNISASLVPEADEIVLSQRAYMRLGSTTSGDPTSMLTPMLVRPSSGTKTGG